MGYRDKMGHRLAHLNHAHKRELHERDSHGSDPVMNVPADDNKMNFIVNSPELRQNAGAKNVEVQTVESLVYVTLPQEFAGDAQLSTANGQSSTTMDAAAAYESAKAAAAQGRPQSSPSVAAAEATSTPAMYTAPQPRTRSSAASVETEVRRAHYRPLLNRNG